MIDWLVQSAAAHPDLADGIAPEGLLSEGEQRRLATLKAEKRRRDWLLGRWTAKRLLQSRIARRSGIAPALDTLVVESAVDGSPHVIADDPNLQSAIYNLQLSISHCDGHALCATADDARVLVGADMERVEPRSPRFAEDYFTLDELAQLRAAPASEHDTITTLIWSAKEAALKALRLGLTVDTRSVSVALGRADSADTPWAPLSVRCSPDLLSSQAGPLDGWWRVWGEYVLTIVVLRREQQSDNLINVCQ